MRVGGRDLDYYVFAFLLSYCVGAIGKFALVIPRHQRMHEHAPAIWVRVDAIS